MTACPLCDGPCPRCGSGHLTWDCRANTCPMSKDPLPLKMPPNQTRVTVQFSFTLWSEDPDRQLAEDMAEAIFDLLGQGPDVLDAFDYSVDGFDVTQFGRDG